MTTTTEEYKLTSEDGGEETIQAKSLEAAVERLKEWLSEGDYGEIKSTIWVTGHVSEWIDDDDDDDGWEVTETVTVSIDPSEPKCSDGHYGHDWHQDVRIVGGIKENPGVWGHGGGVVIVEACHKCGCGKTTDTWAQNPSTGEQGLTSVKYVQNEFSDAIHEWCEQKAAACLEFAEEVAGAWTLAPGDREDIEEQGFDADRVEATVRCLARKRDEDAA